MGGMRQWRHPWLSIRPWWVAFWVVAWVSVSTARPRPRSGPAPAPNALASSTKAWKALASDGHRRSDRGAWLKVIAALENVGRRSSGPTAALALLRAGRAAEDLAKLSGTRKDAERAERLYLDSGALTPASLADDALLAAAGIQHDRLKDVPKAMRTLERAAGLKGDRRTEALALLARWQSQDHADASSASGEPRKPRPSKAEAPVTARKAAATGSERQAEAAPDRRAVAAAERSLEDATVDLRKATAARQKPGRDEWIRLAKRLQAAGEVLAPSALAARAFLRAGRAWEAAAGRSSAAEDARRAVESYLMVSDRCPGASEADDALVAAASIESRILADPAAARRHLEAAIVLGGDRSDKARELARDLDAAPAHAAVASTPAPSPASASVPAAPASAPPPEAVRALQRKVLADTELSLSEQVGLKIRRIIVDAGHGGHDTGAIGPTGVREKEVTLAVARELATNLRARGYEVLLTRDSDVFLALDERTEAANRERGDLFISVHANAHPSSRQSGVETYSLNVASDRYAMRLAARENATLERSNSELQFLLADLATRANTVDSARLAREVQSSVVKGVSKKFGRPKDHGVKHALFYVLLGAKMPAVLVETAFLSNPAEEKKLASSAYQAALGRSIAEGVDRFVSRRQRLAQAEGK